MKVLLTGYAGFLGHHLGKALRKESFSLRVLFHRHTVTRKELETDIEVIWGSIDNSNVIRRAVDGVDCVVHSDWSFSASSSERPTINEKGTELVFKESVNAGVKAFVFISSVAIYGMSANKSLVNESSPLATERDLSFIYPSEKTKVECDLQSYDKKSTKLGIFRPGPIFDDKKGLVKKIVGIAGVSIGIGLGNGRNCMAFIHADDVADAVVKWLKKPKDGGIFNVTPTVCLPHIDWYRRWGNMQGQRIKPIFVRGCVVRSAAFGVKMLKKVLGKQVKSDVT